MPTEAPKASKRRLAAVLSADAVGYSRMMGENEEETIEALADSRRIFHEGVAGHEGRVVDTAGDSVLAVFDSVVEALRSAVDIQEALRRRNEGSPPARRMAFRIGLNVGDLVEQADGTVYGDGVNIAARLQSLAEPGTVCISEVAYAQARNKVDAGFEFLGEQEVKNIAVPVRAYRVRPGQTNLAAEPRPSATRASIAVLPFDNMSVEADQEYFSDGITEDLITALSRIRWLLVVARNSTFTYKGKAVDVKQVGRELGVRYVLEGSVRRGGKRVRITAQLIDTVTGGHVWAERYDRELADVFALQDEITETITAAIEPELANAERERARRKPPQSLDAWDLYHRALWHLSRFSGADNAEATTLLERAIVLDPACAAFHAELARAHFFGHALGFDDSRRSLEQSFEASRHALGLDGKDAMAHCMLGRAYGARGEYPSAIAEIETALRLNGNLVLAHYGLGLVLALTGRAGDALAEIDWAERLSPHDPYLWLFDTVRAWAWISLGDYERACEAAGRAVRRPAELFPAWATLASALAHCGRMEEARTALAKTMELNPKFSPTLFDSTWPNTDAAFFERFFDGLRRIDPTLPDPRSITRSRASG